MVVYTVFSANGVHGLADQLARAIAGSHHYWTDRDGSIVVFHNNQGVLV